MMFSRCVLALMVMVFVQEAFAQASSRRRGGEAAGGYTQQVRKTDADRYEELKKTQAEMYEKMQRDYREKYTPAMVNSEMARMRIEYMDEHAREPDESALAVMRVDAEKTAKQQEEVALKAQRDGMEKQLSGYAQYQVDVKQKQADKHAKLVAAHEARRLPESLDKMYLVLTNGMVLSLHEHKAKGGHVYYPYKLYADRLSALSNEMGMREHALFGRGRYNSYTGDFEYQLAIDYTKEFDIPLNYELVKQACGEIYDSNDLKLGFEVPEGNDLAADGSVKQWRASSKGMACPYIDMDYANCKVKKCLKRERFLLSAVMVRDPAQAYTLGKQYLAEAEKTRRSLEEIQGELAQVVAATNRKAGLKKRQEERAKCPRALCDDIVINQFIIDQTWGRAPDEKPVW